MPSFAIPRSYRPISISSRAPTSTITTTIASSKAPTTTGGLRKEFFWGEWAGAEARLTIKPDRTLRIMVGSEGQDHFRVYQTGAQLLDTSTPQTYLNQHLTYQVGAAYLLVDWTPFERLHISAGARYDTYSTFGSSLNPRLALIVKPYEGGTTKLMLGKAFRAPSIYELYYNDGGLTQIPACNPNCALKPETIYSAELEHTHHFTEEWSLISAIYASRSTDLIALRTTADNPNVSQYANTDAPVDLGRRRAGAAARVAQRHLHHRELCAAKDEL